MRFDKLLFEVGIECPSELVGKIATGIVTDSRLVTDDCIFVCISGSLYDGHEHIEEAAKSGAAVIVAEKVRGECVGGAAIILVENTRHIASLLYNVWYGDPVSHLKIIGITGTNGKTSTALLARKIFETAGYPCGFLGTIGCFSVSGRRLNDTQMTTPHPELLYGILAEMLEDGAEYVFMEVSSHALAQCRTDAIAFDTAVFTNLTEEHLDFHKNMKGYYRAKEKLFRQCRRAIINVDDAAGNSLFLSLRENGLDVKSCSLDKGDFCALLPGRRGSHEIEYALKTTRSIYRIFLPLIGDFQIMNSLEAAAIALTHGIPAEVVQKAFLGMSEIPGRLEAVTAHEKQDFDIFIDYAHTPDALEKLLKSIRTFKNDDSRVILIFGCGGEREKKKRKLMGQIASALADTVIVTEDNSRTENADAIIADILKGIDKEREYTVIADRREAISRAVKEFVRKGDVLVLAGKGHETYQIDMTGKHPFDEREILREALNELYEK